MSLASEWARPEPTAPRSVCAPRRIPAAIDENESGGHVAVAAPVAAASPVGPGSNSLKKTDSMTGDGTGKMRRSGSVHDKVPAFWQPSPLPSPPLPSLGASVGM